MAGSGGVALAGGADGEAPGDDDPEVEGSGLGDVPALPLLPLPLLPLEGLVLPGPEAGDCEDGALPPDELLPLEPELEGGGEDWVLPAALAPLEPEAEGGGEDCVLPDEDAPLLADGLPLLLPADFCASI